jgi:hypothetical protein
LPRAFPAGDVPERLLAGYFSRPLVPENFGAAEALDAASGRSLKDWQTFYQGASRLVEYLNYVGYGGQMLTVMAVIAILAILTAVNLARTIIAPIACALFIMAIAWPVQSR